MTRLIWRPRARKDMLEISEAVGRDRPNVGRQMLRRFRLRASALSSYPRLGPLRPDLKNGLRVLVDAPYLIVYRLMPESEEGPVDRVEVLRVLDGRRDLAGLI